MGGDGDSDGGLAGGAAHVCPAHVLARIGHGELRQAQAGPRHLGGVAGGGISWARRATSPCPTTSPPTWCLAGRAPPRLYQVMVAWPWPATMQSRSRVCPSVTEDAEDSMRMGGVTPVAVRAELRVRHPPAPVWSPRPQPRRGTHGGRGRHRHRW